jgi:hypothetical protein
MDLVHVELKNLGVNKHKRSQHSKTWVVNVFDAWKQYKKINTFLSIGDFHELDSIYLMNNLFKFML